MEPDPFKENTPSITGPALWAWTRLVIFCEHVTKDYPTGSDLWEWLLTTDASELDKYHLSLAAGNITYLRSKIGDTTGEEEPSKDKFQKIDSVTYRYRGCDIGLLVDPRPGPSTLDYTIGMHPYDGPKMKTLYGMGDIVGLFSGIPHNNVIARYLHHVGQLSSKIYFRLGWHGRVYPSEDRDDTRRHFVPISSFSALFEREEDATLMKLLLLEDVQG